jgi:competence protein ComEA
MKNILGIALGVLIGLLAAAFILLIARQPQGEAISLLPPPTPGPILVQVSGEVSSPGVYRLPPGSRAMQAIEAAGGLSKDADPALVNLAAVVADGDHIIIPGFQPTPLPPRPTATPWSALPTATVFIPSVNNPVNINIASQAELEALPGIGVILAQQIIAYREAVGPFERIEDVLEVPGIRRETFEMIKKLIIV